MALFETLTIGVGGAVARTLLKLWLRDGEIAQTVGLSLTELAERGADSFFERRSITRSFDRVAEEVARKLAPFIEVEFERLEPSEVRAALRVAQDTIDVAPLDDAALFASDLEPLRLEAVLRAGSPNAAEQAFLSEGGTAIYDFTIRETSNYIAEVISTLPEFHLRATRELLSRESRMIALVEEVLERLPDDLGIDGSEDPGRLEGQYRREVARKLDRLDLFGVQTSELNKRYALSVAYIGLTATTAAQGDSKERGQAGLDDDEDQENRVELAIEKVLSRGKRHLIRGEAGSGKTTLLQWLAVSSARRSLDGSLDPWKDTIPFFIQLRRFVGEPLPQPSSFPATINRSVAEKLHPQWASNLMEQGRALVLIDGVDELREDERATAADWLRDLIAAYPDAHYVVTSRPPAVSEDWLDDADLLPSFLEPMDIASTDAFIEHWHDAAKENAAEDDEVEELNTLATRLQATVRENAQIRSLATSPLLCAMLCALNRDWKAQLPRDRVELYRVALEMLLERRDIIREVAPADLQMSRPQKEVLLQAVAFWLLINGLSDAKTEDLENLLQEKVESMPRLDGTPSAILRHLLLRSGLIREPVEGRIDFIHRTFQEYLTAKQVVEDRSVGLLLDRAVEDQWQEVVVLAAGLGSEDVSQQLIRSLLARAEQEDEHRHRLQLLAVACLETTPVLPKALQTEIETALRGLIPPRSMSEAKAIASAGSVAIPLLANHHDDPVATAAPSARALGLIGGPSAMATLERFSRDSRVTVARELLRSWDYFPSEEYAERVLRQSPLDRGRLSVHTPDQLRSVRHLEHLSHLRVNGTPSRQQPTWDWTAVAAHPSLETLEVSWVPSLVALPWTGEGGKTLRRLEITACDALETLSLDGLDSLETLQLAGNSMLVDLPGVDELPKLRECGLAVCPNLSEMLRLPTSVEKVSLRKLPFSELGLVEDCVGLTSLALIRCEHLSDIDRLADLGRLRTLTLNYCPQLHDLFSISRLRNLDSLKIREHFLQDLSAYHLPDGLSELALTDCPLTSLDALTRLTGLRELDLTDCVEVTDCTPLSDLANLQALSLAGSKVDSLRFVESLQRLEHLDLEGCSRITSLRPLEKLPNLTWLDMRGCAAELDPQPLIDRGVQVRRGPGTLALNARTGVVYRRGFRDRRGVAKR
ncbi:MAG TPA: NACHT domain-containing protein [Solirubrobacterales bacterium]|nr:NACHT domain-containing protein [Solirubrobacterales bacterium]